jgi:rSAM/selenodomain-associated transferase 1
LKTCVCVFAKPPGVGLVKTRLIPRVGAEHAARLASAFLHDVWALVSALPGVSPVLATTDIADRSDGLGEVTRWAQGEGDLGQKLERVLSRGLADHPRSIAIGADVPDLPQELLELAIEALATRDVVLVPARDGGFVLIGVTRLPVGALGSLPWSTAETFARTLERLHSLGLSVAVLDPWEDVDDYPALLRLDERLRESGSAPRSRRVLAERGLDPGNR